MKRNIIVTSIAAAVVSGGIVLAAGTSGPAAAAERPMLAAQAVIQGGDPAGNTWGPAGTTRGDYVRSLPQLRQGATGAYVVQLQLRLNTQGSALAVDGIYGPKTFAAVTQWQRSAGIADTGIVGVVTWNSLVGPDENADLVPGAVDPGRGYDFGWFVGSWDAHAFTMTVTAAGDVSAEYPDYSQGLSTADSPVVGFSARVIDADPTHVRIEYTASTDPALTIGRTQVFVFHPEDGTLTRAEHRDAGAYCGPTATRTCGA